MLQIFGAYCKHLDHEQKRSLWFTSDARQKRLKQARERSMAALGNPRFPLKGSFKGDIHDIGS